MITGKRRILYSASILTLLLVILFYSLSGTILCFLGEFLVLNETPEPSDAVVVLSTGMEYYPRLMEAAQLYRKKLVKKVVINGNRKTDALRNLERMGIMECCPWYEESFRILELLGVPRNDIRAVSAEDAYDTISEAEDVGPELIRSGIRSIIVTTSKSHTKRARHIWKRMFDQHLKITIVAAEDDPYLPGGWWKSGRQVKWVLAEYGAFLYLLWNKCDRLDNRFAVLPDQKQGCMLIQKK